MLVIKKIEGLQDYQTILQAMRDFTDKRHQDTTDEIWLLQHQPVFSLGQASQLKHPLTSSTIPVVQSDRGGQITYHGPGQLIAYLLIDLKRRNLGVRDLVSLMENSLMQLLHDMGIESYAKKSAPGVYVRKIPGAENIEHKIASLGLRIRKGCCYHGLALNINMDLSPFQQINPCGYAGLAMTQLADLLSEKPVWQSIESKLIQQLDQNLTQNNVNKNQTTIAT